MEYDEPPEPTFIVGTGRSGSTALYAALARHPDVAWLSSVMARRPEREALNRVVLRAFDVPILRTAVLRAARPSEAYPWWDARSPGFSRTRRDLTAADVTPAVARALRGGVAALATVHRTAPVLKITGWPRVGFLSEVFPRSRFVHLVRDGRAVAVSSVAMPWWDGWVGPPSWRWGPLDDDRSQRWYGHDRSYLVLAGLAWELLTDAFDAAAAALSDDRVLEVRYEELCADSGRELRRVVEFAGLRWPATFDETDWGQVFADRGSWRSRVTPAQARTLDEALASSLVRRGYV